MGRQVLSRAVSSAHPGAQRLTGLWQFLWFVIVRRVENALADDPEVEGARVQILKAPLFAPVDVSTVGSRCIRPYSSGRIAQAGPRRDARRRSRPSTVPADRSCSR
jgi:hypothetical protein